MGVGVGVGVGWTGDGTFLQLRRKSGAVCTWFARTYLATLLSKASSRKLAASRTTKPSPAQLESADGAAPAPRGLRAGDIGYGSQVRDRKPHRSPSVR